MLDGLPVGRGEPVSAIAFASGGHESLQRRRLPGAQLMLAARNCVARRHLALLGPRCGKIVKVDARRAACPNHMPPARPSHPARPTHRTHTHPPPSEGRMLP